MSTSPISSAGSPKFCWSCVFWSTAPILPTATSISCSAMCATAWRAASNRRALRSTGRSGALPKIAALTARDALAIKLALMEALSNVLHHSSAKHADVTAAYDRDTSAITIAVSDNGCGFDPAVTDAGRGLANMRQAHRQHLDRCGHRHRGGAGSRNGGAYRVEGAGERTPAIALVPPRERTAKS